MARKKIAIVTDKFYQKNRFFDEFDIVSNRDDCLRPWIELKKSLKSKNISIDTVDITPIAIADIVIFLNVPDEEDINYIECISKNKIKFCVITELGYIHENNLRLDLIETFDVVFTYQQNLVNNKNIFKLNYSFDFQEIAKNFKLINYNERKLLTNLIAGNKAINHKNELYSTRIQIIKWFEQKHPGKLDLYGLGWNQKKIIKRFNLKYNYLGFLKFFVSDYYKSYKGPIENKNDILKKYKFSFTIENAKNVSGWITEKIFDSIFNGCVPVYLGANNISEFVDSNCFIDLRQFKSLDDLYDFLINLQEKQYNEYQKNIINFLIRKGRDLEYEFGLPYFKNTIEKQIINYLKND